MCALFPERERNHILTIPCAAAEDAAVRKDGRARGGCEPPLALSAAGEGTFVPSVGRWGCEWPS